MPGERSVQIGRDATENVIITGEHAAITILQTTRVLEPDATTPSPIGPNPYKGLAAFQEEDADRFFGRERMVEELWEKLRELDNPGKNGKTPVRLFAVQGPSGSGKSSLVRAGLLPELARRPLYGFKKLRVCPVVPGAHPLDALALALARLDTGEAMPAAKAREFSGELAVCNSGRYDGLRRLAGDSPLLVFSDQFEEVYTLASAKQREIFVANLLEAAADPSGTVMVLLALRNDFLPHTRHNEWLHEIVTRQNMYVRYLREDELRRAIAEPALRAGHPLDDGTVELLVQETRGEEQALPPLQFTLSRIWERMSNGVPPAQTYREIGGVGGSLAQEAQRLYDSLSESDQWIARRAFLRMVRVGYDIRNTARKVDLDEVVAHGEDRGHVKAVLERFARPEARIVTLAAEPDGIITARLTHEALLERWKQFDDWLTPQVRQDLLLHYRLEEESRYWNRKGRHYQFLWPRQDLERLRAYEWSAGRDMTAAQWDFFTESNRVTLKTIPRIITNKWLVLIAWTLFVLISLILIFNRRDPPEPVTHFYQQLLLPDPQRGAQTTPIELHNDADLYLLSAVVPGDHRYPDYRLVIMDLNGLSPKAIWSSSGLRPRSDNDFNFVIPREFLEPGEYRLELFGIAASGQELLATYTIRVHNPS